MTPLSPEVKAIRAAKTALTKITELHHAYLGNGVRYCALCFKNWPCDTHKFAEGALKKIKEHLSR